MDKYARQTFELNFGPINYFPTDVYEREIPKESLDVFMTSPPCQAFSMAGKRLGKEDKRGILFFNSLEFIRENKPRYFIFENVKGLLSHDKQDPKAQYGRTFQEWINYLGGKSVNGVHTFFPYEDAVPYHIYFQVLNAKDYNIPQNRERIFIIGIRDDEDNDFTFPKPIPLTKRLKDVLEPEVDEKYFLSDKMIECFIKHKERHDEKGTGFSFKPKNENDIENALRANAAICATDNMLKVIGYTRDAKGKVTSRHEKDISGTIHTASGGGGNTDQFVKIGAILGRNPENPKSREIGLETKQMLEINENGTSNALTTVQKDNVVIESKQKIRRLTPTECFRLMDFNTEMIEKTINSKLISDSQLYKQAGNSICVGVLAAIISKLKL